jgi:hypothetical protein
LFYFEIIVHDGGCCCCLFEKGGQKDHFEYAHELMEMQSGGIRGIDHCTALKCRLSTSSEWSSA